MSKILWRGYEKDSVVQEVSGIPTDYIAYYKFDGDFSDETGTFNGNTLTYPFTTDRKGISNGALSVIANDTQYLYQNTIMTTPTNYTISFWINITAIKYNGNSFTISPGASTYWRIYHQHQSEAQLSINIGTDNFGRSVPPITLNTWTHFAVSLNNNITKVYKNGSLYGTTTPEYIPYGTMDNIRFPFDKSYLFDDLLIYERTLSDQEVSDIYNYQ